MLLGGLLLIIMEGCVLAEGEPEGPTHDVQFTMWSLRATERQTQKAMPSFL